MKGILSEVMNGFWMIERQSAIAFLPVIANIIKGNQATDPNVDLADERLKNQSRFVTFSNDTYHISEFGEYASPEDAPKDSIAIMQIHDVITYYDQQCGPAGMATKSNIVDRIGANPNIKALIIEARSGGGEGYASAKMVRSLQKLDILKIGFIEDIAASAAYRIIAACDLVIANSPQARVGSIGTYQTLAKFEQYFKLQGIEIEDIYATKSTKKNEEYIKAIAGDKKLLIESIDFINESFINEVAEKREDKLADPKFWEHGQLYFAEKAEELGLIDDIMSFEDVLVETEKFINS